MLGRCQWFICCPLIKQKIAIEGNPREGEGRDLKDRPGSIWVETLLYTNNGGGNDTFYKKSCGKNIDNQ